MTHESSAMQHVTLEKCCTEKFASSWRYLTLPASTSFALDFLHCKHVNRQLYPSHEVTVMLQYLTYILFTGGADIPVMEHIMHAEGLSCLILDIFTL